MEEKKYIIIINPISGEKYNSNISKKIHNYFNSHNIHHKIIFTKFKGEAPSIVKKYLDRGHTIFIAVGGDGTVNEIAATLINTNARLGIIPKGSGNGLARHLKIPLNLHAALENIKNLHVEAIDYGTINENLFFCTSGIGFDAHIGNVFSKASKRGFFTYFKATIKEYLKYKAQDYKLNFNGKTVSTKALLITFANASQYGNNAVIAPKAKINDGILNVVIVKPFKLIFAPIIGLRLFNNTIDKSKFVETFTCKEINIEREKSDVIHFDGEPISADKILNIKIIHKAINVITPANKILYTSTNLKNNK
ncbi:MAG: diacylglycerol kinase family lipid kinase, partial [Bacteroidales bacterium]|nr:diacylglycerol kinase family lipid kinase [Bacteroidales bacterium]